MTVPRPTRTHVFSAIAFATVVAGATLAGCATGLDGSTSDRPTTGQGGSSAGTGGSGTSTATGGSNATGSGGSTGNGGSTGSGGSTGNGGSTSNGGSTGNGGSAGSGGTSSGAGGSTGQGGSSGAGGSGGASATGVGGTSSTGTGGSTGVGGTTGTGGSGPVTTGIPYTEDFEDGVANGWVDGYDSDGVQSLPVWTIVTDGASKVYEEPTVESDPSWAVGGNRAWTDQHLEAKAKFVSGSADGLITLVVRFVTFKTYCFLELHSNQIKIRVKNNGSTTDIGVAYKFPTPLVDGTWYQVGLAVQGSNLTAYFGGMPVATGPMPAAAVPALTAGGIALTATDSVAAFDDVSVTLP